ncbi:MAG TPA: ABC transporter permease [Thermomicrobiales bacterium]
MGAYVARRLAQALLTLFLVSLVVFAIMRATPGDPAQSMLGNVYGVTPELLASVRHEMGLDKSLPNQYLMWLADLARGDFGHSYISQASVGTLLARRLPASLELALAATLLALAISVPAGVLSALRRGSWIDHLTTTFVTAGIAMPGFWLAMLIVLVFAVHLKWLPPSGYVSFAEDPVENLRLLILPASTLAILVAAPTMRFLRSSMLNVLSEDYVRTARAKGLIERTVVYRHALRNALIPTVTWIGLQFAYLVGGSVMIEWVFGWPGIGWFALKAVLSRDYVVVQSTVVTIAAIFVLVNLIVDLLYAVLDPRVRLN